MKVSLIRLRPEFEFQTVLYIATDSTSWSEGNVLNYRWLAGLIDLNTEKEYIQQRIEDYLNDLVSVGE